MSQNIIVLIGPPGGGKGSISKLCIERFGWQQLSTGNLCRDHISRNTDLGKKIDLIIKSGKLISDNLITEMVEDWLRSNLSFSGSVIFDGYPRTVVQVEALKNLLNNKFKNSKLNLIRLLVKEQTLINRLSSRIVCSNNKCQTVYSLIKSSSLAPKKIDLCDKCESKLIQRADDKEEAVKERLKLYKNSETELIEHCMQLGFDILEIDAEKPIEEVFAQFNELVN